MGESGERGKSHLVRWQIPDREGETKSETRIGIVDHLEHLWQQLAELGRMRFEDPHGLFAQRQLIGAKGGPQDGLIRRLQSLQRPERRGFVPKDFWIRGPPV